MNLQIMKKIKMILRKKNCSCERYFLAGLSFAKKLRSPKSKFGIVFLVREPFFKWKVSNFGVLFVRISQYLATSRSEPHINPI